MRLVGLQRSISSNTDRSYMDYVQKQTEYADFLLNLRANRECEFLQIIHKVDSDTFKIGLPKISYFTESNLNSAIEWLYPNMVYDVERALRTVILASTNEAVGKWNTLIQNMNNNQAHEYLSRDSFSEVDDEKGILSSLLDETTMNRYNSNGIPPHRLTFKKNDVCIILRAITSLNLATYTKVQVMQLHRNFVTVKTLNEKQMRYLNVPRITFKFHLEFGESYEMTRIQIPMRLAYSMTYNKSQSQTLDQVLIDFTGIHT